GKCGTLVAKSDEELKLKLEQEYFSVKPAFIGSILSITSDAEDKEDAIIKVKKYFGSKNIEVEE
ncbi:MAG: hypothetical protein K9L62_16765, partial [Vallitaleaceae bacterium]|nr:hypothetical protein [Vallitaleaceae bacterium]